MSTESPSDLRGNVQTLRAMWSEKVQGISKPPSIRSRSYPAQQQKEKPSKDKLPTFKISNPATTTAAIQKESMATIYNEKKVSFEPIGKLPLIEEDNSSGIHPSPPPSVIFKHQVQSIATMKQSLSRMSSDEKQKVPIKNNGIHHWHITRHVFRSGLIFNRSRRASDSILPLLIKTHTAHHRLRTDSMDSTLSESPFENRINYLTYDDKNNDDSCVMSLLVPKKMKRSTSDTSDCIRRNKLDDSIFQYEMILRHLKNHDKFMSTRHSPSLLLTPSKQRGESFDNQPIIDTNVTKENSRVTNRTTQSLSRNIGRTFSQFIMNDPYLNPSFRRSSDGQQSLSISHASSQTDLSESIHDIKNQTNDISEIVVTTTAIARTDSVTNEEAREVLNELDTMLENSNHESPITPNSEINVIVINTPDMREATLPVEMPLMQRLFEGKKTAYSPADLMMKSIRLPEEMIKTYDTAKKKCFFDSEEVLYTTKMIKVSRRGYKQHVRMLCITTERLYNLTKKDPYPKEGLLFSEILGITCTPCKDGFICIHTRESHEDRGDWLVIVDHPCEFITQLFTIMGRDNNDDNFLKIETKFKHCRRFYGETCSNDCSIEVRKSDVFRIKVADFDAIIIYTP